MLRPPTGLFVLAVACNSSPTPAPELAPREAARPAASASPDSPKRAGDGGDCVESCVARRQMQAVSPEQIEADCRRQCEPGK